MFYGLTIFFMFLLDYYVIDYFDRVLNPANIYLFKVAIETLEKGVKYVQL